MDNFDFDSLSDFQLVLLSLVFFLHEKADLSIEESCNIVKSSFDSFLNSMVEGWSSYDFN